MLRQSFLITFTAIAVATASAQTTATADVDPASRRPVLSRVTGIFDDLPQLDIPGTIKLTVRPHVGDFIRRDYLRSELGLRWSLNENFEINTDASVFITHGLGDNHAGNGIGRVRLGGRYVIEDWPKRGYDTSFALNMEAP